MAFIFITKEKTNWKYLLIIVILALIVAGESLLLLKQGTNIPETKLPEEVAQDETADWKTCTNEKYGFEIKYPNEWVKDESTLFPDYMKEAVNSATFCTFFIPKTKRIPEDVWISASTRSCKTESCDPREEMEEPYRRTVKQSTIGGKAVYIFDDAFEAERNLSYILINEERTRQGWLTLAIHHGRQTGTEYLTDEEIDPELQIFQQMLSTFRFLD